jgi:hypothetical protein
MVTCSRKISSSLLDNGFLVKRRMLRRATGEIEFFMGLPGPDATFDDRFAWQVCVRTGR